MFCRMQCLELAGYKSSCWLSWGHWVGNLYCAIFGLICKQLLIHFIRVIYNCMCERFSPFRLGVIVNIPLPHQAGIELSDFHARVWKSDQGGQNSMQEMHGNQTKCMEFQPIKKSSNFWTSILCPGINFSCSKSLWIWWTIDPLILACLKLMTYASFSTKQLLAVLMDGNPCTNGWNSMHQNRKNVIASCFFEQSCLRQVKFQDPWQT